VGREAAPRVQELVSAFWWTGCAFTYQYVKKQLQSLIVVVIHAG
jgi:hypothetical protein